MKLTKTVAAHDRTLDIDWIKDDFLAMSDGYRKAREKMRKTMDSCFWCKRKFDDGEMMALAGRPGATNILLCQSCAVKAREEAR